jgi:hypothetical protein
MCFSPPWNGFVNRNVGTGLELHNIAVFVSQRIFNSEISIPVDGPTTAICALSFCLGRRDAMILSTVPGIVALDCSGIRDASRLSSAIRTDLDMRGFANSFLTRAVVASPNLFLFFFFIVPPSAS